MPEAVLPKSTETNLSSFACLKNLLITTSRKVDLSPKHRLPRAVVILASTAKLLRSCASCPPRVMLVEFLEDVAVVEPLDSTLWLGWIKRMREAELALSLKTLA